MEAADSPAEVLEEAEAVPGDVLGIVLSVCLIGVCGLLALVVAGIGRKRSFAGESKGSSIGRTSDGASGGIGGKASSLYPEIARKIVHIGVSNWFFIYYFVFDDSFWSIVGLCAFALVNAVLNICGMMGVLFAQTSKKRNWGMVYYPLSVAALVVLADNGFGDRLCVGCALIGMGYGDGLAAILGTMFGRHELSVPSVSCGAHCRRPSAGGSSCSRPEAGRKTLEGSAVMFVVVLVSFVAINVFMGGIGFGRAASFGIVAALAATVAEAYTPSGLDNVSVPALIYLAAVLCRAFV